METAVMMRYFPEGIDPEFVKKLKPARLTRDNLKSFGKSDEETMKMIPDGYFGDPASYDMEAAEAYIEAVAKSYAEAISGYLAE